MDTRTYFNFPDAGPEPEAFPTFDQWVYMHTVAERRAIERLISESIREAAATRVDAQPVPAVPPIPDAVPMNASIIEAWTTFYSASRPPRESAPAPIRHRPRPARTRPGSEDPSAIPDSMREAMRP